MTRYYELQSMHQGILAICALLVMIPSVFLFVTTCVLRLKQRDIWIASMVAAVIIFVMQGMNDVYAQLTMDRPFTFTAKAIGNLPYLMVIFVLFLLAVINVVLFFDLVHKWKHMLKSNVIKESIDALPDGICFFDGDGQPLLVNTQMNRLSGEMFGTEILNAEHFWSGMQDRKVKGENLILRTEPTMIARTKDEKIWDFHRSLLKIGSFEVHELVANDITEQYRLNQELYERNKRLGQINERLRLYSSEVERITSEKEILTAKMRVHDDIGRSLLAFRSYLAQKPEERDREKLGSLWQYTIEVLKNAASPVNQSNELELLLEAAHAVDVSIRQDGELPENEKERGILIAALHECLTNTVKHAQGNTLYIVIRSDETGLTAQLRNNGNPPYGEIQENGGLKNLRHVVESAGGIMKIESIPHFLMRIELPKGGKREWKK